MIVIPRNRLKKWRIGWGSSFSTGASFFEGYPGDAASPVEPDVAAQFLMDEASGAIVDEVASLSCAVTGSPTYNVMGVTDDAFNGWMPGITYADGTTQKHINSTPGSQVDLGLESGTVEVGFSYVNASSTSRYFVACFDGAVGGYLVRVNPTTNQLFCSVVGEDLNQINSTGNLPTNWRDGNPHKIRFIIDRTGMLLKQYFDGVLLAQADITALDGVNIPGPNVCIGNVTAGALSPGCTIWYVRISKNSTNNCGGPGGG